MTDIYVTFERPVVQVVTIGGQGPSGGIVPIRAKEVAFADPLILNWVDADTIDLTLTASLSDLTMTGANDGQRMTLRVKQGGIGGYTIAFPANVRYNDDIPSITLSVGAGRLDFLGFQYHAGDAVYDLVAITKGAA